MKEGRRRGGAATLERRALRAAVVRFAGDSGDGMQLTGNQFAHEVAWAGNDLATLPDYPSEIRAPQGTLFGVSSFQVHFGSRAVHTPGDEVDVLVAMNPAALKVHLADLAEGGVLLVNSADFTKKNLERAGYRQSPLEDPALGEVYRLLALDVTGLTRAAVKEAGLALRDADRCKNFFCLGITSFLFNRPVAGTLGWLATKFAKRPQVLKANELALTAGWAFAETLPWRGGLYEVPPARLAPGRYRQLTGNRAAALGLLAAARRANKRLVYGAYPITPASDILHELAIHKAFDVCTFQAEDEIAAIGAAVGAAFGGAIAATGTSGPGLSLKSEMLGLAVISELPVVIVNVQRAGPSTGLPTKTEQADLLQALFGRHGECPLIVLAAATPDDCFALAYEAVRLAVKHMTPVILLSDTYLANGSAPWRVPQVEELPEIPVVHPGGPDPEGAPFLPFARDAETLARPWAVPGTPGLEHTLGGLEKQDGTGAVCHYPDNHDLMVRLREEKVRCVARDLPPLEVDGPPGGELLVVGWGSTCGAISRAVEEARADGLEVSSVHLRCLNPLPPDLGPLLGQFRRVLVPEINRGQLLRLIRAEFLVDAVGLNRVRGLPLKVAEVREAIADVLFGKETKR